MQLREARMPDDDTGLTTPATPSRQTAWPQNRTAPQQARPDPVERHHQPAQPPDAGADSMPKPDCASDLATVLQKAE